MNLTLQQLRDLAASVGFPNPPLAAAVAMAESKGNPQAVGDPQYGDSIGLWQINLPAHPNYDRDSLFNPTYNAQAALAISNNGNTWTPWTTFRNGDFLKYYKPELSKAMKAAIGFAIVGGIFIWLEVAGAPRWSPRTLRRMFPA